MKFSGIQSGDVVSVAVDTMAMSPDRSCLAAKSSDSLFMSYAQPLARPKKCLALHIFRGQLGRAGDAVQLLLNLTCRVLSEEGTQVRYVCSDGDAGYNKRHPEFFKKWYRALLNHGLPGAFDIFDQGNMIPISDFLHHWKNFCTKVKNHPVAICPKMAEAVVTCQDLDSFLDLGNALSDKSSISRIGDSYALQLFSLADCLDCMEKDDDLAMLYLLPWDLQEEVIRSPTLGRSERLEKAIPSCYLLLHYVDLSFLPRSEGVTQRFNQGQTTAITFVEDSVWSRILNDSLALIHFIIHAPEDWSFSRLGTHCLENSFGFVRRNASSDDRSITAFRIIAKAAPVSLQMQHPGLEVVHRGT
jgi:hypothetical protein